jgi:hypothetical protein
MRSRVRVLAGALIKIITAYCNIHVCGLEEPAREGECWSISELPTFPHELKLYATQHLLSSAYECFFLDFEVLCNGRFIVKSFRRCFPL